MEIATIISQIWQNLDPSNVGVGGVILYVIYRIVKSIRSKKNISQTSDDVGEAIHTIQKKLEDFEKVWQKVDKVIDNYTKNGNGNGNQTKT